MNVEMGIENNITPPEQDHHQATYEQFTCEICIELTSNPDKWLMNGDECSHPFCTDCMINYIRAKLEYDSIGHIMCPALNCDLILDPVACATLVGPATFLRWTDVLCEVAIADREKRYCPYTNCNVLILNECGGNPTKTKCPSCKRMFCFHCERVWHVGFRCEESNQFTDRNDVVFRRLVESKNWKRCPRCRHFTERWDGCSNIRCRCGILFCYNCGKQVCCCRTLTITRAALRTYEAGFFMTLLAFTFFGLMAFLIYGD